MVLNVLARDVYAELLEAREQIRDLQARLNAVESARAVGISGAHGPLTTPLEFSRLHRVSVSTVNRALNSKELLGIRQPNNRWLVYADQPYSAKRNRG